MKLVTKMLLLVLVLVLITGMFTGVTTLFLTDYHFEKYLGSIQDERWESWHKMLSAYYQQEGSWNYVGDFFDGWNTNGSRMGMGQMWGSMSMGRIKNTVVLTDSHGFILLHPDKEKIGDKLNISLDRGKEIVYKNEVVGYVFPSEWFLSGLTELEYSYKSSVTNGVIFATIVAILLALGIGVYFSRKISAPLQIMTQGINKYKNGDINFRLKVPEEIELADLAREFNSMADSVTANIKARQNLVADVAHELRTPLTIISGRLESTLEKEQPLSLENVAFLTDEVIRLSKLVGDLQKLSLVDNGNTEINVIKTDIVKLLKEMEIFFNGEAEARSINFNLNISEDELIINTDTNRLKQVLLNLVNNAFQHTDSGGTVKVYLKRDEKKALIQVEDTGKGISKEDLPHIFERFYRAEKSRNRMTGGMGLGLAIAKGYVEALGGAITVDSELGKGTRFTILLPNE